MVFCGFSCIGGMPTMKMIEKWGRRKIMLISLPMLVISWLLVSFGLSISASSAIGHILFFTGVITFLLFFSFGFGGICWVINSEIYPIHLIGTASSLSTATNWLFNFIVSSLFLSAIEMIDGGKVYIYLVFAMFAAMAAAFVW